MEAIANFRELTVLLLPPLDEGDSVANLAPRLARHAGVRFVEAEGVDLYGATSCSEKEASQ